MALLEVKNVKKIYTTRFGGQSVQALKDVSFSVEPREYVWQSWENPVPARPHY